jgi:hypothetical protein
MSCRFQFFKEFYLLVFCLFVAYPYKNMKTAIEKWVPRLKFGLF